MRLGRIKDTLTTLNSKRISGSPTSLSKENNIYTLHSGPPFAVEHQLYGGRSDLEGVMHFGSK
jgi:hypothetical protein